MSQSTVRSNWPLLAGTAVAAGIGYLGYRQYQKAKSPTAAAAATAADTKSDTKSVVPALSASQRAELAAAVEQWLAWDPNATDKAAVSKLWNGGNATPAAADQLYKAFIPRISFGTAGLRSRMSFGYACMNDLIVLQTSQGLARYAESEFGADRAHGMGIVIGYDGRYNSKRFAEITAGVFLSQGFTVHLFTKLAMTPIVYGCACGVMVTASHNPKADNGYKVYWANGAQIIPPHDAGIATSILNNLQPWKGVDTSFNAQHPKLKDPTTAMSDKYFTEIGKLYHWNPPAVNTNSKLRIAYTAMHGVGTAWIKRAFEAFGLVPFVPVKEQVEPDPEFPTVEFPNPEEGKGALALSIKTADQNKCNLILANDPDADRLAVAEKDAKTGEWRILNGNQIGVLFAYWTWANYVATAKPSAEQKRKALMLSSTVSSKMLKAMAKAEGFSFWGTLTGFKWMGNVAERAESKEGYKFLFAYEVEIGFLVGNLSLDKDGVRCGAIFAEMANHLYAQNTTLWEQFQLLQKKYGYFAMTNSYYFCYQSAIMEKIFTRLRTANNGTYVDTCGPYKIASVRDVTVGYDSGKPNNVPVLPKVPDAQMITFRFANGGTCTLRGSGTEPKLKFYVEIDSKVSDAAAQELMADMTQNVIKHFLQPEANGLIPRKAA